MGQGECGVVWGGVGLSSPSAIIKLSEVGWVGLGWVSGQQQ